MQPTLIVLAAGMGSRYGGLKQLDGVGPNGETIMDYSVFDAVRAGFGKVVFVIRKHFRAEFEATFAKRYGNSIEVAFVEQEPEKELPNGFSLPFDRTKPWGTAHAMLMAAPETKAAFAVINADDFYGREAHEAMGNFLCHIATQNRYAMVGYQVGNTLSDSGGVSRGVCSVDEQGFLAEIIERHRIRAIPPNTVVYEEDAGNHLHSLPLPECSSFVPRQGGQTASTGLVPVSPATPVSMNFWGFTPDFFTHTRNAFRTFIQEEGGSPKSEFYIPTVVNHLIQTQQASIQVLTTNASWFGVTYQEDRPYVKAQINKLIATGTYPHTILHT